MLETGLEGLSAFVTGGASGIGQSIAVGLASEGARVRVADIRPADDTLQMVSRAGGSASAVLVDVRSEEGLVRSITQAVTDLAGIDLFVNVAATYTAQAITEVEDEIWSDVLRTNVTACALACKAIAKHMIERGNGSILIVGSTVVCAPSYAGAAYRASKTALRSYTETLAIELAPFGVRVNMLTPGPFPTGLVRDLPTEQRGAAAREVPLGQREGRLPEVRAGALFLLSDRLASYITGAELFVDGGLHLRPLYIGPLETVRELNER
jgi:NAD(P)-dependent dehydrogenase (short-subunit alcohol dehydrogenase family)